MGTGTEMVHKLKEISELLGLNKRTTYPTLAYDAAGNLVRVVVLDVVTGNTYTLTLAYDAQGNLISVT